jgi:hypothetical protein
MQLGPEVFLALASVEEYSTWGWIRSLHSPSLKEWDKNDVKEIGMKDCPRYGRLARDWRGGRKASGRGRSTRGHHIRE